MKLFLVRHGQSTGNLDLFYTGQRDVPLTELGRSQAMSIRPILAQHTFDRVYSSDLIRAVDTQRLALPGVEGIRTPWLREFDVGSIQGLPYDQVRGANPEWKALIHEEAYARFGGESLDDVCTRVGLFLKELEQNPCQNVAAFAHNGIMGVMMRIVLGVNFDRGVFRTNNCGIHVFEYDGTKWRLLAWNYMGKV